MLHCRLKCFSNTCVITSQYSARFLSRTNVNSWTAPAAIPRRAHVAPRPSKARRVKVWLQIQQMCNSCYVPRSERPTVITTKCSCSGLVPESPTFFISSPFKVLSPQPAKFLKSLLPVKEESKARKVLEARPLLGQEVKRMAFLVLQRGFVSLFINTFVSSFLCHSPFLHFTMLLIKS